MKEKIDSLKNTEEYSITIIILDFTDLYLEIVSKKILHFLILDMMHLQEPSLVIIGVGINKELLTIINEIGEIHKKNTTIEKRIVVFFKDDLNQAILGIDEEKDFLPEISENNVISERTLKIINKNNHLFRVLKDKYYFTLPKERILDEFLSNI